MFATPKGFRFAATAAGFRKSGRNDLALMVSDAPATSAAVFTTNRFCAAPVEVAKKMVREHDTARAVVINSGTANACTGQEGIDNCLETLNMLSKATGLKPEEILPASTGVIGTQLKMDLWSKAVPKLVSALGECTAEDFAKAILTTDAFPKISGAQVSVNGGTVTILGMAKGAGMICPNMATMLCAVACDAAVSKTDWREMLKRATDKSFNRVTVDGDTSTNDTVFALANGASNITVAGADLNVLEEALTSVLKELAFMLVQDGEGATKVMRIRVRGCATDDDAQTVARTVGHSQLVKTAMYGRDANWGRIVAAVGRSGVPFDHMDVEVSLCGVLLFRKGQPVASDFDALLEEPLKKRELAVDIVMGNGNGAYELLASDLTHAYVDCNASYRS